ncbi:hypothetical protein [Aeromicrobium ginsengisoli]|uniref:AbiTii domain-containing protein n=1 Tax=Aeromicrobium ginsengisoli TaxID=363867 RepID=A0A5M4FBV5_9ACTN|nr:hypothetical protein [Aeromicrobium ginsengisoli]KAA1395874.1 hypothetical protein ESP70_017230 [Aeromicrobium ginsengisoli]
MSDTLLQSLRERLMDESEPLSGLLRKCLMLGAETGSDSLRDWARRELNGYGDEDEVPRYRRLHSPPISADSQSGPTWVQGQILDRLQIPPKAREYVSETIPMKQPIEELEQLAGQKKLSFSSPGLAAAMSIWNRELGPFQSVSSLSYVMSGSHVAGILGQVRTNLVEIVADLTSGTPLTELPGKDKVDAAVDQRVGQVGDVYNTTIHEAKGAIAVGTKASATFEGLTVEDVLALLDKLQEMTGDLEPDHREELMQAVGDLRSAVEKDVPDTGDVVKKAGKLRALASKLGVPALTAAAGGIAEAVASLALSGAFG